MKNDVPYSGYIKFKEKKLYVINLYIYKQEKKINTKPMPFVYSKLTV